MSNLLAEVDRWCTEVLLPVRRPLHLLNVRPTAAELADHPQSFAIQAYFAGARHAAGEPPQQFPRPLTDDEAECWMNGWGEHRDEHQEVHRDPLTTLARPPVPGILATDWESWYDYDAGRAGDPTQEAS